MDLTPQKETNPWWTLLRCCNPSDELHKENDGDEKTGTMSASTSATTECSDDSSEQVIEKAGTTTRRVSFTTPVETDAIITVDTTENTNAEPTLVDSDDDDDDDDDDGDESTLSIDSKNPHVLKNSDYYSLPFRTFLFYMVLRNIIGVDYLSDRVFSGGKRTLMITSGVSPPHDKTGQGEVVAESD